MVDLSACKPDNITDVNSLPSRCKLRKMAWYKKLEICLEASRDRVGNTWAQLATVRGPSSGNLAGRPANRTVNVRRTSHTQLCLVSDERSGKCRDVLEGSSNHAELCWFFFESKMQFRISGRLEIVTDGIEREEKWAEFGETMRACWAFPTPGSVRKESDQPDSNILNGKMPAYFCLCILHVDYVDVFDQNSNPMVREKFTKKPESDAWDRVLVHI